MSYELVAMASSGDGDVIRHRDPETGDSTLYLRRLPSEESVVIEPQAYERIAFEAGLIPIGEWFDDLVTLDAARLARVQRLAMPEPRWDAATARDLLPVLRQSALDPDRRVGLPGLILRFLGSNDVAEDDQLRAGLIAVLSLSIPGELVPAAPFATPLTAIEGDPLERLRRARLRWTQVEAPDAALAPVGVPARGRILAPAA